MLKEALESVHSQSYKGIEVIVVVDGSTNGTAEHVNDSGVHCISLPRCGRPGKVRNIGARAARGEYLAFLDSDDLWKPEKLARKVAFFEQNTHILICHTREIWLHSGKTISQSHQRHARSGDIFKDVFNYPIGYIDEPLVIKRGGHAEQLSERYGQIEIFRIKVLQINLEAGTFKAEQKLMACKELVRKCRIYSQGCLKRNRIVEGRRYELMAARYDRERNSELVQYGKISHSSGRRKSPCYSLSPNLCFCIY